MLMPSKVKFRKQQRGRRTARPRRGATVAFGDYGLKVLENGWITARQIEASRVAMTRFVKRGGKIWVRIFPDKPITKKPTEVRMGKGKGAPGGVGRRGQARARAVRDGRRRRARSPARRCVWRRTSCRSRRGSCTRHGLRRKGAERWRWSWGSCANMSAEELAQGGARSCARRSGSCGCSAPRASSRTPQQGAARATRTWRAC